MLDMQNYASAVIEMFDAQHGGRKTPTTGIGGVYRPHLKRTVDGEFLGVFFVDGPEIIGSAEQVEVTMLLVYPNVDYSDLIPGATFLIVEGPHVVGKGVIKDRWSSESGETA